VRTRENCLPLQVERGERREDGVVFGQARAPPLDCAEESNSFDHDTRGGQPVIDDHDLPKKTENTLTTREELFDELELVRKQGWAKDNEESVLGLRCVAIPIMASEDENLGGVSITGPTSRMTDNRIESELIDQLKKSANIIEVNYRFS